jgi:hypothetical protein
MNGYELSRGWFDFAFENPNKITPVHGVLYLFIVEHCNRMGWKKNFGLPTTMAKEAIGVRSYNTYKNALDDLVEWGFVIMVERSKNQFSSNIVALSKFDKASDKALDKALIKHGTKQRQSTDSIDKPLTLEPNNQEQKGVTAPHPLVKWIESNAPTIQRLKEPLTNEQAERLLTDLNIDTEPKKKQLRELLMNMENYKPLTTKSKSANLTIRKWWAKQGEYNGTAQATEKLTITKGVYYK